MTGYDAEKGKGKILKRADTSTIQDKFLVGYQGWTHRLIAPESQVYLRRRWRAYRTGCVAVTLLKDTRLIHFNVQDITDGFIDVSSYSPSELFPAPGLKTQSGDQLFLFSSRHPKTVQRHFHWMAEHGVDGAFLQRFATHFDPESGNEGLMRLRDEVGDRVREAAEKEGRAFAIM
ncbi:hypothetical protein DXG03_009083 [Asterophora parasitica]|uniref:Uncharacterized protein n=1 Tax=Asterophora parasitica TaxID=117018 RepID=A0A9P7G6L9_9AGAR|nr:hypothetical protein DXG03_009083 [Asterophora parasitica]